MRIFKYFDQRRGIRGSRKAHYSSAFFIRPVVNEIHPNTGASVLADEQLQSYDFRAQGRATKYTKKH